MAAIEVSRVTKKYGDKRVVDDVSFRARQGRVTGFVGPNGAGKSSTLRILLGIDYPASGNALIEGKPYQNLDRPLRTCSYQVEEGCINDFFQ